MVWMANFDFSLVSGYMLPHVRRSRFLVSTTLSPAAKRISFRNVEDTGTDKRNCQKQKLKKQKDV